MVNKSWSIAMACGIALAFMSCENQKFNDTFVDSERVHVDTLSIELQKVRDYVPQYAVVAHRGSTYWTPEETEAAYRWAREMGADYLECDMQVSKDGVILALHDTDLKRTTNIEDVFGERFPEKTRRKYYSLLGYTQQKIDSLIKADREAFVPNYPCSYTYYELMLLDAGTWFNQDAVSQEQGREGFSTNHQYISTLQDLIMFSKGYKLKRYSDNNQAGSDVDIWGNDTKNERVVREMTITSEVFNNPVNFGVKDNVIRYHFGYVKDDKDVNGNALSGNLPGIYIEFKEPWLNPSNFEQMVYDELQMKNVEADFPGEKFNMNIIAGGNEPESNPFYKDGKINVGNTNGKVILQTFSLQSLTRVCDLFDGQVPMCFLLWLGTGATDLTYDDPQGYASFINLGVQYKAHYIGPCISGAPNNYPELNYPWQHNLIHRAKMKNHPYSFDTYDQMAKYFGQYNWGAEGGSRYQAPYLDAFFTNHTDMSLQYMVDFGYREAPAPTDIPDAREVLDKLGYEK